MNESSLGASSCKSKASFLWNILINKHTLIGKSANLCNKREQILNTSDPHYNRHARTSRIRHFGDPKFGVIALKVLFYEFGEGMRIEFATSAWM